MNPDTFYSHVGGIGGALSGKLTQSVSPYITNYPITASSQSPKTSGIQYELDSLRGQVILLRDAVFALEAKVTPVSFSRPPLGNGSGTSAKPSASAVSDAIAQIRADLSDITNVVQSTRDGLDL